MEARDLVRGGCALSKLSTPEGSGFNFPSQYISRFFPAGLVRETLTTSLLKPSSSACKSVGLRRKFDYMNTITSLSSWLLVQEKSVLRIRWLVNSSVRSQKLPLSAHLYVRSSSHQHGLLSLRRLP